LNIGVEKVDTHEGVTVKALLDNSTMEMFMDQKIAAKHGFKLQKLKRLVTIRNIDRINNSAEAIIHQIEVNVYYKSHIERMRIDIYDLGKTEVILEMLWLQVHNPETNWETKEVKMIRCPPLCRRNTKPREEKRTKKGKKVVTLEEEKIMRWTVDNKKNWRRKKEVEADHRKIKEMVL